MAQARSPANAQHPVVPTPAPEQATPAPRPHGLGKWIKCPNRLAAARVPGHATSAQSVMRRGGGGWKAGGGGAGSGARAGPRMRQSAARGMQALLRPAPDSPSSDPELQRGARGGGGRLLPRAPRYARVPFHPQQGFCACGSVECTSWVRRGAAGGGGRGGTGRPGERGARGPRGSRTSWPRRRPCVCPPSCDIW